MGRSGLTGMLGHLRGLVAPPANDQTDGVLLSAYCGQQDQSAFAALVKRHGPLVQMVCGRILRRTEDREDAFQATFLVLARDAASLRKRESIAGWLHGVARHVSLTICRAAARRHKYEEQAMTKAVSNPAWEAAWREVQVVLHDEIARLPERYREPFVLCCLESQSGAEVAARLGIQEGTVRSRLTEARRRLRERLARRGVDLQAVFGASALAGGMYAHVPAAVTANLANTAAQMAAGQRLPAQIVSARIVALVQGVPKAMFLTKTKLIVFLMLVAGMLAGGVGAIASHQQGPDDERPPAAASRQPAGNSPAAHAKGGKLVWKSQSDLDLAGALPVSLAYSPDSKILAVGSTQGIVYAFDAKTRKENWETRVTGNFAAVAYSADGQSILATYPEGVRFLDAVSGKEGASLEEKGVEAVVLGVFPDKEFFAGRNQKFTSHKVIFGSHLKYVVKTWVGSGAPGTIILGTANAKDSGKSKAVPLAVDPEGRTVILRGPIERESGKNVLWAWVAGDNSPDSPGNRLMKGHEAPVVSAAWSRNGKRAVTGDAAGRVILWDAQQMKEVHRLELGGRVAALALSPKGDQLAVVIIGKRAEFLIGDPTNWQSHKSLLADDGDFEGPVYASLAFSPDGRHLAGSAINMDWLARLGILVGHVHLWQQNISSGQTKP